jgi:hypothetical protein
MFISSLVLMAVEVPVGCYKVEVLEKLITNYDGVWPSEDFCVCIDFPNGSDASTPHSNLVYINAYNIYPPPTLSRNHFLSLGFLLNLASNCSPKNCFKNSPSSLSAPTSSRSGVLHPQGR